MIDETSLKFWDETQLYKRKSVKYQLDTLLLNQIRVNEFTVMSFYEKACLTFLDF